MPECKVRPRSGLDEGGGRVTGGRKRLPLTGVPDGEGCGHAEGPAPLGCGPFVDEQKNDAVSRRVLQPVARRTMSACGPFWPCEISKSTR